VSSERIEVCLGQEGRHIGDLIYAHEGQRESVQFRYTDSWLNSPQFYPLCPELGKSVGYFSRSKKGNGSVFFDCFADTEPNGWGRKLILRDHALQKQQAPSHKPLAELSSLDFLLCVDDFSRQGALRFRRSGGDFLNYTPPERRKTPPALTFEQLIASTRAVELGQETQRDLELLRGRGSDLDGMRPKCTVIDLTGALSLAKFPSVGDTRSITRSEMLAIELAGLSGINVQKARLVSSDGVPVLLIARFDRENGERRMYNSAATVLSDFDGQEDHAYTELSDAIRQHGCFVDRDTEELWRRMVFNILIRNVDDHLHNHGFLHVRSGQWELAPAFDINPFPEKKHILKLWISEESGLSGQMGDALKAISRFGIKPVRAKEILKKILEGTQHWREHALKLGIPKLERDELEGAFDHEQRKIAQEFLVEKVVVAKIPQPLAKQSELPVVRDRQSIPRGDKGVI
jgi:serine/threonine-protein kinase HipA